MTGVPAYVRNGRADILAANDLCAHTAEPGSAAADKLALLASWQSSGRQSHRAIEPLPANPLGILLRDRHAGQHSLVWARPDMQAPENLTLTSPAFGHGTPIPDRHRGHLRGPNISPALAWTPPPAGTAELVLIVQDPDAPTNRPATHALTIGIPPTLGGIPENGLTHPSPLPGLRHGKGPLGHRGYAGPLPLRSHGRHTYVFQLFALDRRLDLPDAFALDDLLSAITGHVIGRGRLDGTYEIR